MLMGPVFRAELLRIARRRRHYALRLVYGLILLWIVVRGYDRMRWAPTMAGRPSDVARFAGETFRSFAVAQMIAVLAMVPAVFGGAIADEKQRRTLPSLMASRLSSGGIVLDKVLGRSASLAVFVAIGLPVVALLGLFGGISADEVFMAYAGTFATAAFAMSIAVLLSTMARRVRGAVLGGYLLTLIWLLIPPAVLFFGTAFRVGAFYRIKPINDWLVDSSPTGLWLRSKWYMGLTAPSMLDQVVRMVGLQLAGASLLLLLAVWRLRPTFRSQEDGPAGRTRPGRGRRRAEVPACGDDPVFWKERHFTPSDRFSRRVLATAMILMTIPLTWMTWRSHGERVILTLLRSGYTGLAGIANPGEGFLWALQVDLAWFLAFWLLAAALASASSVTMEREQGTWASLTATPMTGREILRGKMMGVLWNHRGFAVALLIIWALGLITTRAHPVGVLASIALTALLTWFVATVGLYCSLRAPTTSRAMAATLVTLACFNGYPLILFWFLQGAVGWESSYPVLGFLPTFPAWAMVSGPMIDRAWDVARTPSGPAPIGWLLAGLVVGGLFIYAGTALALSRRILLHFDRWLDRPPLDRTAMTPATEGLRPRSGSVIQ